MDDQVPDFFEDPLEELQEKASEEVKKLHEKYGEIHNQASYWAAYFMSIFEECQEHPDEEVPDMKLMMFGESMKTNLLLIQILDELRKLKNPSKE